MTGAAIEIIAGVTMPWHSPRARSTALAAQIPFDAMALAIFGSTHQQVDELLLVEGWPRETLADWLASDFGRDALITTAQRRGGSETLGERLHADHPLRPFNHAIMQALPVYSERQHWWCLLMAREQERFTAHHQSVAGLLLRSWQAGFDEVTEPGAGRLIIGHDDRLIHADPMTELSCLQRSDMYGELLRLFHPVVNQRWPSLNDGETHDFLVNLSGARCWVRFCRDRATQAKEAEHWYIELRNLFDELPAVAVVEDQRIAHALAFLHDAYEHAPSLSQVAQAAHVSPFHFHRLFTNVVGISPKQYLQRKQLQVAKWLLRTTHEPIGLIASRTGFASHGHFTSTFRRVVGVSPSEYREEKG